MAQNRHEPLPEFILNSPELPDCDDLIYNAFVELDTCRQVSFGGVGSIPWDKIVKYGEYLGLDDEDMIEFVSIISLTDNLLLKKMNEEKT